MAKTSKAKKSRAKAINAMQDKRMHDYLNRGRMNQKQRTRDALVDVAVEMIKEGKAISIADVADVARVSRTTAYRYFPKSEMLVAQATMVAAHLVETHELDEIVHGSGSAEEKLDAVIVSSHDMTHDHEAAARSLLRLSADSESWPGTGCPRRPPYRRNMIEAALEDKKDKLGPKRFERLTATLSLLCGVEALVVLKDICLMERDAALDAKRWAAQQLLAAACKEAANSHKKSTVRKRDQKLTLVGENRAFAHGD